MARTTPQTFPLEKALAEAEAGFSTALDQLKALTEIPSVSFDGFDPQKVRESAEATARILEASGLRGVRLLEHPGTHPYVYGEWLEAPGAPTLLLYAHHDVQPPMREALWKSPAFTPTERDGRLFARGIADDKAGILVHAASIAAHLRANGALPLNVKVLIEGEEEIGSPHLAEFLAAHRHELAADALVLTDCANYDTGIPSLTTSLRGLIGFEITVSALDHPLHSGMWGGPIPDPVTALAKILAALTDANGRVAVPGLLEDVIPPTAAEMKDFERLGMTSQEFRRQAEVLPGVELFGEGPELLRRLWREPSLTVNSLQAGGKGLAGNVLLDSAWARFSLRLVPGIDAAKAAKAVEAHVRALCPWGLRLHLETEAGANAWRTEPTHPVFAVAKQSLGDGYGREAALIGCGGTIPFVEHFTEALGDVPALLVGVEDPYTNAHSENESLHLGDFRKAILAQVRLFSDVAASLETRDAFDRVRKVR